MGLARGGYSIPGHAWFAYPPGDVTAGGEATPGRCVGTPATLDRGGTGGGGATRNTHQGSLLYPTTPTPTPNGILKDRWGLSLLGPLMGGTQCRLSISRNGNVPVCYFLNVPVNFKVVQCRLLNLRKCHIALSNLRIKGPFTVLPSEY